MAYGCWGSKRYVDTRSNGHLTDFCVPPKTGFRRSAGVDEEDLRQDLRQDRILAKARRRFVFELNRIIDDDFRGRYLERELVARSPEAIQP